MNRTHEKPRDLWTDEEFILAFGQEAKKRGWPVYLGRLQRPGWSGRIPTYLVWCPHCRVRRNDGFTVAHEAGYGRRLECAECGTRYDHLLPTRIARDAVLNPHRHPRFIAFLFLLFFLAIIALR